MLKHTVALTLKSDSGGTVVADSTIYSGDSEENVSDVVAAGKVLEIALAIDYTKIVSVYVESDQALPFATNSVDGVSPAGDLIPLAAKKALIWNGNTVGANPFTHAITHLFFDNTLGAVDANVKAGFLLDEAVV